MPTTTRLNTFTLQRTKNYRKTKSINGKVVKDYNQSTLRQGYNFVMDIFVGSTLEGVEELGWFAAGTGIGAYHSIKDALNGGTGANIRVNMRMPIYTFQNGKPMKTDLSQFSFGERVSMGFSGITTIAGGTGSIIKTGIKDWPGKVADFFADKTIDYYIGKGLEELKEN